MPFFFIIARSVDEDEEKKRLESSLKEYFPYIINFNIFPLLARGTKRTPSFGLKELMEETEKFFKKDVIQEIFKEIYKEDEFQEHLLNSLNNNSDIKTLFTLILNKMRLDDYSKELNDNENQQMDNFKNIYQTFVESHFYNIRELCCLIKAKNKIIDRLGIGDWGWGIGDWGLGPIPNPTPIPNPQSPILLNEKKLLIYN